MSETPALFAAIITGQPAPSFGSLAQAEAAALKLAKENVGRTVWVVRAVETVCGYVGDSRDPAGDKDAEGPAPFNFYGM